MFWLASTVREAPGIHYIHERVSAHMRDKHHIDNYIKAIDNATEETSTTFSWTRIRGSSPSSA